VSASFIRRQDSDGVTTLAIDRLEYRNKINQAAIQELHEGLLASQRDGARLIVLTGTGDLFCTGGMADGYPAEFSVERHLAFSRAFIDLLFAMGRCAVPIVARINGDCLAGGTMLLSRCDLAVSVDSARFGLPEMDYGGFPMMALATALEQFPAKLIFEMAYLGATISAVQAQALHVINRVCTADGLDAEIDAIAARLATRSQASMSFGRQTFYALLRGQTEARLEQTRMELTVSAGSEAVRAGARPPATRDDA
jgi:methylglutaconyl-CoA hydratase